MNRLRKQKVARFLFWALLIYTALSSTIAWSIQFGLISVEPRKIEAVATQNKPTSDLTELAFAEQFTREYFLWTVGKEESRKERLHSFLVDNIDAQAGVGLNLIQYNSYVQNVNAWSSKQGSNGVQLITVYAQTIATNTKNSNDQKRVDRYLVVPLKRAGDSYRVVDLPYIISPPVASNITVADAEVKGDPVSGEISEQVNTFMHTFWKVYTTGTPQEIAYYFKNKQQLTSGLTSIEGFVSMDNLSVSQENDTYVVNCDVTLQDLQTGAQLVGHYQFTLVNESGRWYVISMKQGEV